ncbi:MAG TPA: hypothetical protein DD435_10630 [Cyanobacteria bacterium UBA8530]|nr:hypothetical protein [Cyanobacteria bacterium UBA8530]
MAKRSRAPKPVLRTQALLLLIGLVPLGMLVLFWLRSGSGMHRWMMAFTVAYALSFLLSINYYFFYRQGTPKTIIHPSGAGRAIIACLFILPFALINLWGVERGWCLTLSPNVTQNPLRWIRLGAKLLLGENPTELAQQVMPNLPGWVYHSWFLHGALWGALGYALVFGVGGAIGSFLRREVFDPRQEPFGGGLWFLFRPLIGLYYGTTLGFCFGGILEFIAYSLFGSRDGISPTVGALIAAFGCVPDPNRAMTMAFSAAGLLFCLVILFMGRPDFTVVFTDPKTLEKEPPMKVNIPELPKTEAPQLDFGAIVAETDQLTAQFAAELRNLVASMGLNDVQTEEPGEKEEEKQKSKEPPTRNVISARTPDFDTSFDGAMGQLSNVYVQISAQLGSVDFPLAEWLTLEEGSMLEFPRAPDNSVILSINHRPVGRAKPVVVNGHIGVKVLNLTPDAISKLKEARR